MRLRDNFWLWGHPEGRYNMICGNMKNSRMTPMECCLYLGIRNTFMIPLDVNVNRRQYNKSFTTLRGVAWEGYAAATKPELIEPLIEEAKEFPNIRAVAFDDFVRDGKYKNIDLATLKQVLNRLRTNDVKYLESWMVLYTREFGADETWDKEFMDYIEPFNGIMMWTWNECDYDKIVAKFERFKEMTPHNRRMFGCYLWNFGDSKEVSPEAVKFQLDFYREKIMAGEAEGVILHTNTMADCDYAAYDAALEWMNEHGDEELPESVVAMINSKREV